MNYEDIRATLDYLRLLIDLRETGTHCNAEINAAMQKLTAALLATEK